MKRIIVLGMLCLLLAACAPSIATIEVDYDLDAEVSCAWVAGTGLRICEIYLSDGTLCISATTSRGDGGVGLACNWK